ncbi:beta-1,3-galactosyl-O-glycosyl-glycoprotein beta-1,6-N-acetylglucosaminyltransferase-like [Mizuhopecten yessoensis]|uniref:Beta-1,3-galactosyl-O-glycosyl-glycoprotein beta-1,6-N-acetylglucosaminyltransferase n=1 Tax=Mizuhopecten yessoensis TaxID=6573 RepID=A0A210QCV3_MIZYE|nr:beta-1,3-galactosyl-O-glycosyl-glycoprotein beta-1,6-N-acetylglucosaminyltransferase-like [Mizuhopecten yessoensis]XP_021361435.1 beta-1,3-galactosyl-O-glycosyl-glycoprotein beta-1,6-N-acetylglucosaminyltransferase-like [Mizuhopecten yessoensis]OWF46564.1 Beta-1,3-galactosyl-O-glycosyl-glycoprotein beta-1,6-N-acetylglucosaminyltransferase [Mizuhopecten yessoensis]
MSYSLGSARAFLLGLTVFCQLVFLCVVWDSLNIKTEVVMPSNNCNTRGLLSSDDGDVDDLRNVESFTMRGLSDEDKLIEMCKIRPVSSVNCKSLFTGDSSAIALAKNTSYGKLITGNCSLNNLVNTCKVLIKSHGYLTDRTVLSGEELDYPLAFAIKMHKSSDQAEQLLRLIYRPHNVYCLYIDKKASPRVFDVMKKLAVCFHNIFVIQERIDIIYASLSHVLAEMQCMHELLARTVLWKYYINLTGQELPLRTNLEMVRVLKALKGTNDIESFIFPKHLQFRVRKHFTVVKGTLKEDKNTTKEMFSFNITLRKGSAYGIFRREFVEFLHEDIVAQKFIHWLNDSLSPEETIWATLNGLPWAPGGYSLETSHAAGTFLSRAVIWTWDKPRCLGRFSRSVCIFGIGDLPWLASRPQMIANKFDRIYDPIAPDCMEELIRNRTKYTDHGFEQLDWYFYRNLPHVKYYANRTQEEKSMAYLSKKKDIWTKEQQATYLKRLRRAPS